MSQINIQKLNKDQLKSLGVFSWPVWQKEVSTFPWQYDEKEACYIIEGKIKVTPEGQHPVEINPGDYVVFPEGMSCTWEISSPVKKHYKFG